MNEEENKQPTMADVKRVNALMKTERGLNAKQRHRALYKMFRPYLVDEFLNRKAQDNKKRRDSYKEKKKKKQAKRSRKRNQ